MDVDLVSVPQMLKNGCSLSAVGKLMLIKDKDKKIVFRAVRDNNGLYLAHEKDVTAYNVSVQDDAIFEKLWARSDQDGTQVKGVISQLKGVARDGHPAQTTAWLSEALVGMSESGLERLKKMIEDDQDEQYSFERMKMNMSEPDFVKFIHGHYTMQERKRAVEAWEAHSTMGHMSQKQLGDAFENGLYAGSYLTRADVDRAYKLFGGCVPCSEAKFKLPPEPESTTAPTENIGETLNVDIFFYRQTTLGGNDLVVIATDQKTGAIFHAPAKRKTAESIEDALMRIVASLNRHSHKVCNIVFDDEAVFQAMERRIGLRGIASNYTPAGLHNKPVERAIQSLKAKMRAMRADLDYQLPAHLTGELLSAAITAMNATPNTRTGPNTTPCMLISGKRPQLRKFKFGQAGLCECRRQDAPDTRAEWGIFLGITSNVSGHIRVYIPERGMVYSRRSFKLPPRSPSASEPSSVSKEWNYKPRLRLKPRSEPTVTMPDAREASELEARNHVSGINGMVQGGPTSSAVQRDSAVSTLGFDDEDGLTQKGPPKTSDAAHAPSVDEKIASMEQFLRPTEQ
jgi:hypothetical protein